MSQIIRPASGTATPPNAKDAYEDIGFGSNGLGTVLTAGAATPNKGSWVNLTAKGVGGVTANALSGLHVQISGASSATQQYGVDISINGGSSVYAPSLYAQPGQGTSGGVVSYFIEIPIPAGAQIAARCQSTLNNGTVAVTAIGVVANATSRPGYTSLVALNFDAVNVRPAATALNIPLTGGWVEQIPSTAAAYKSLMIGVGNNGSTPAQSQNASLEIGVGASGSEVEVFRAPWVYMIAGNPRVKGGGLISYRNDVPQGSRIAMRANAPIPGSDGLLATIYAYQ